MALPEGKPIGRSKSAAGPRDGITAFRLVQAAKRLADIAAAIAGIILFSPLLLITSVAIKLDSRGPVLIRQTLYGQKSGPIKAFKFRFVTACAENDPASYRLTRGWPHAMSEWHRCASGTVQCAPGRNVNHWLSLLALVPSGY